MNDKKILDLYIEAMTGGESALRELTILADLGNAIAQNNLADMYSNGEGVEQDYKEAVKWFTKAAEQGLADAQYRLGCMYNKGEGVEQDSKKAFDWYTKAAEQGHALAQYNLGVMYRFSHAIGKDYKKAFEWYTKAAEQGYEKAQYMLADMYYKDLGVEQDYKKALYWYTEAAKQGDALSQYKLANMYCFAKGVDQDYKQAFYLYTKAAEQGLKEAQFNLSDMYYKGEGVDQDYKKAVYWLTKAAEQNFAPAQCNLANMYIKGEGVEYDCKKALDLIEKIPLPNDKEKKIIENIKNICEIEKQKEEKEDIRGKKYERIIKTYEKKIRFLYLEIFRSSFIKFLLAGTSLGLGGFYLLYAFGVSHPCLKDFMSFIGNWTGYSCFENIKFINKGIEGKSIWMIAPISATLFWLLFNVEKKLTQLRKIKIDYEFKILNYENLINSQGVKVEDKLLSDMLHPVIVENLSENPMRAFDSDSSKPSKLTPSLIKVLERVAASKILGK